MNKTSIEWTHRPETRGVAGGMTWNPIRARIKGVAHDSAGRDANGTKVIGTFCTKYSPGCAHCYAELINKRFGNGLEFTVPNLEKVEFFVDERILQEPLKQKKPYTIFVGDMFDLFHEAIGDAEISYVFATMKDSPQHTFQLLTKRAARMQQFINHWGAAERNIWLGVSVEDQQRHDQRVPLLQDTPAAVRFLSVEPQLEDIRLAIDTPEVGEISTLRGFDGCDPPIPGINWVICGGESGPSARPFNLAWAESLLLQCSAANVPFFMKQVGSNPEPHKWRYQLGPRDRKGGDMREWPPHLQVRDFPTIREAVSA